MKTILWAAGATSISSGASATSLSIQLTNPSEIGISIQLAWTGTTAGTIKLQSSNDNTQWDDVEDITDSPAGAAGQAAWIIDAAYFNYVRVVFTRSAGTGLISGTYNIKRAK